MSLASWLRHRKERIKKGYSYRDVYDISDWFLRTIPNMLEDLAKDTIGVPSYIVTEFEEKYPELSADDASDKAFDFWRQILREIAEHFREAHEPAKETNEFDFNFLDDNISEEQKDKYFKREEEIEKYRQVELQKGLEMFCKYFNSLWW